MRDPSPRDERAQRVSVCTQFLAMGATTGSWAARIPSVRTQVPIDDAHWGLATLGSTAGSLISMILVIRLVGRVGPRRLASAGAALLIVNAPVLAGSTGVPGLIAGLLVQGLATGLLAPSMNAQAVQVEQRYRRRIMSSFHACFSVGQLGGGLLGAFAAQSGLGPRPQLAISGGVLLSLLVGSHRWLPADPVRPATTMGRRRRSLTPQLTLLAGIAFLASLNEGAAVQWSAQYSAGYLAAGAGLGAVTFTSFSVSMAAARIVGDRAVARLGRRRFVVLSEVVVAVGMGTGLLLGTVWGAVWGFVCLGVGSACIVPTVMGLAGRQPGIPTAVGVSAVSLGQWPAILLGPPLVGGLAGLVGLRAALAATVVAAIGVAVLSRWMREPASDQRTVAAVTADAG